MTIQQPLVSVVIPCYNHAQFVQETIQSVIDQDYQNIELIIIDDGSKDNSVEVIQEMLPACEERFTRFEFRHRPNKGLCATLNEALKWCEGVYFSPLASDDIALPHKTSFLVNKIEGSDDAAVFGLVEQFGNRGGLIKATNVIEHKFEELILQKNIPHAPAALMRTATVKQLEGYDESVKLEDWYMWLKMTHIGKAITTYPVVVAMYRMHESNTVNDYKKMHDAREEIINLYKKHPMHKESMQRNFFIYARESAFENAYEASCCLIKSHHLNKEGLFVLLKIVTPKFLIEIKRSLSSKRVKLGG